MPSKPLFGIPVAVGISPAVMAMRKVPWAFAAKGAAAIKLQAISGRISLAFIRSTPVE